ncbi:NHL repeat-containing protein [Streptomyces nojiriensis]|uniref:NHL repeat-containing protein n=1 Tax=Streptomyces nojiriensis TaxID=66374 RepID=UPI003684C96B
MNITAPSSEWLISGELGARYRDTGPQDEPLLRFPWAATWTDENTCLVVDRRRPRNQVREFDAAGHQVWERSAEPRMNVAVALSGGRRLLVERTGVRLVSATGAAGTAAATLLPETPNGGCAFGDGALVGGDSGVFRLGPDGKTEQIIKVSEATVLEPTDVHAGPDGLIAVTDGTASVVALFDGSGERVGLVGCWRSPGRDGGRLLAPEGACVSPHGTVWVAETRLHRVAEFGFDGRLIRELSPRGMPFNSPTSVRPGPDGTLLVADAGNHRVVLLGPGGEVLWQVGESPYESRLFSWPRSVERSADGLIVCDTFHDRVLRVDPGGRVLASFGRGCEAGDDAGLNVPRSASATADGGMCVADGLNSRVVVVGQDGTVRSAFTEVRSPSRGTLALGDPHQVTEVEPGLLQLVDSDLNAVFWVDEHGDVKREWFATSDGRGLEDPHQAHYFDGRIYVADSANDRIVVFEADGGSTEWAREGLSYPRFVLRLGQNVLVANTDDCDLLWLARGGEVVDRAGPVLALGPEVPPVNPEIRLPKWITQAGDGRIAVADMLNSRVVLLRKGSTTATGERHAGS